MQVSDRTNWLLSGLVGVLLVANGAMWALRSADSVFGYLLAGVLVVGGGAATANAARALQGSETVDQEWTTRRTAVNAVAAVLLAVFLAEPLLT